MKNLYSEDFLAYTIIAAYFVAVSIIAYVATY